MNAATQIIDPWSRHAGNKHIPGDGKRMVGAVERYRDVQKLRETPPTLKPDTFGTGGSSGGSGASSGQ